MRCARGDCGSRADVVVAFGAGLLVLFCYRCAIRALVAEPARRIVRQLTSSEVTIRPTGA